MHDQIKEFFLDQIEGSCNIIQLPSRLWVFGGRLTQNQKSTSDNYLSFRDCFLDITNRVSSSPQIFSDIDYPENYNDWIYFSGYKDLLEFECDACHLANAIILFAESPGAFVELGALTYDETLLAKLFVITEEQYENNDSFIYLGPLTRVKNREALCFIDNKKGKKFEISDCCLKSIQDHYCSWANCIQKKQKLNQENKTHILLLISDLIDLLNILKLDDLQKILKHFNIHQEDEAILKYLNLLVFFKHISKKIQGKTIFYIPPKNRKAPWIDYRAKAKSPNFDRSRFKIDWMEKIKINTGDYASIMKRNDQ